VDPSQFGLINELTIIRGYGHAQTIDSAQPAPENSLRYRLGRAKGTDATPKARKLVANSRHN
jgi:hypothetical protein